jgi:hypothetical protein
MLGNATGPSSRMCQHQGGLQRWTVSAQRWTISAQKADRDSTKGGPCQHTDGRRAEAAVRAPGLFCIARRKYPPSARVNLPRGPPLPPASAPAACKCAELQVKCGKRVSCNLVANVAPFETKTAAHSHVVWSPLKAFLERAGTDVHETCMGRVWNVHETCMGRAWDVYGTCMGHA